MKKYSYKNNKQRYTEKLIDCIGAAIIAGYHNHADILHGLSCEVMGLTIPEKCAMMLKAGEKTGENRNGGKCMRKLKVYLKTPYAFAVEIDGKDVYSTGKAKDIADYCKRHYNIDIPTETKNFQTGTKTHFDGMPKNGFEFDIE